MSNYKQKKIEAELTEDKAKRDASYEYTKKSKEPVAEGAFKGALASGLSARFIPKKVGWKGHAVNLAAGVIGGGLAGKAYNNKKTEDASKAKKWLSSKKSEKEYGKKISGIYKKAANEDPGNYPIPKSLIDANNAVEAEKKKSTLASILVGGGIGGLAGGLMRFKKGGLGGAIGGAALGAAGGLIDKGVDSGADKYEDSTAKTMGVTAATAAAGASIDPVANRINGYISAKMKGRTPKTAMGKFFKNDFARYDKAEMNALREGNSHAFNKIPGYKVARNHIPMLPGAVNDQVDHVAGKKAYVKGNGLFKGIGKSIARKGGKWAVGGLAAGYMLDKLQGKKDIQKEARLSVGLDDAVIIKDYNSKKDSEKSIFGSIAKNTAKAAALYAIGKYGFKSRGAAEILGGIGAISGVGSVIHDIHKKNKGVDFLNSSEAKKKDIVVKDYDTKDASALQSQEIKRAFGMIGGIHLAKAIGLGEKKNEQKASKYSIAKDL